MEVNKDANNNEAPKPARLFTEAQRWKLEQPKKARALIVSIL